MAMISGSTFDFETAGFSRVSRSNLAVETVQLELNSPLEGIDRLYPPFFHINYPALLS